MERPTCKLCFRSFANGRALGGHMRSHVAAAAAAAAANSKAAAATIASLPSESSSSYDDQEAGPLGYGLRENPKKSFRLVDPEFSSTLPAIAAGAGSSVVVQDGESESESSRAPVVAASTNTAATQRRRSKRARKSSAAAAPEPEPVSSVSDTTPEEDVALSLMMLSRDVWAPPPLTMSEEQPYPYHSQYQYQYQYQYQSDDNEELFDDEEDEIEVKPVTKGRSKYQCGTCKKVFRSYQALGGHRASHKKTNGCVPPPPTPAKVAARIQIHEKECLDGNAAGDTRVQQVQHECPVCFRVFSSGQALGGHKRSHLTNSSSVATITIASQLPAATAATAAVAVVSTKFDLNLPAPMEDDAELSAVSDAEFVMQA